MLTTITGRVPAALVSATTNLTHCAEGMATLGEPREYTKPATDAVDGHGISRRAHVRIAASLLQRSENVRFETWQNEMQQTDTVADEWSEKAKRRKTTGTGRMRTLKSVARKFSNGFQLGTYVDMSTNQETNTDNITDPKVHGDRRRHKAIYIACIRDIGV